MLNPNPSVARAISCSFRRRQIPNARRALHSQAQQASRKNGHMAAVVVTGGSVGLATYQMFGMRKDIYAETSLHTPEEQQYSISVQHIQVKSSQENPGVYAWGDNSGKVVAPDSKEKFAKTPRRLPFFDGILLRDLRLSQDAGAAVNEQGDVLQWGIGYADGIKVPETTLKGKNIEKVVLSKDKVIALSKDRTVYSFPISKKRQQEGVRPAESSWFPGWSSAADISYRVLKPDLGHFEKVIDIAAGREHLLVLTNSGRVFSSAAAFIYPSRGQMGIPGLVWETRPVGKPVDTLQEITVLKDHKITQIATGDYHSVVLSNHGEIFTFGDNVHGQLGFVYNLDTNIVDTPTALSLAFRYPPKTTTRVTGVTAGGMNSYFMVDASEGNRTTADVLSCGTGIYGNLGNGRWTHVQGPPTKIHALSGLMEFNEATQKIEPIRLQSLQVGATHCAAVMDNSTRTSARGSSVSDVNYGSDVLWWGNNEFYQLGTGKRSSCNVPVYIQPLGGVPADLVSAELSSSRGDSSSSHNSGIIGGVGNEGSRRAVMGNDKVHRFQITPEGKVLGGRKAVQTVVCGRGNTMVYMKAVN